MKKVAIISSGYFPVPAVKGGAVETLIQMLADENENNKRVQLSIFTTFDEKAYTNSKEYINSEFIFVKTPKFISRIDKFIYFVFYKVFRHNKHMSFRYIMQRIYYIYYVSKYLKKSDFDEVVIENTATLFWTLKLFKNNKKYLGRYTYHIHNIITNSFGCKNIILNSKKVIGISNYINKSFKNDFPQYPSENMVVVKNCINSEKIGFSNRIDIRDIYKIKDDDVLFIFVGRLCREKGVKEAIKAFSKLKYNNAKLLVVGNYYFGTDMVSSFEKELHDLSSELDNRIIFTGFVHNDLLGNYYSAADIAILPSIWEEPAGLTIVEAMYCGLPIITTYSGGIPEYTDENCAILVEKNKDIIENIAEAMKLLYSNSKLRNDMGRNAYKKAQEYNKKDYLNNISEVFEN